MRRKVITALSIVSLVLALSACGNNAEVPATPVVVEQVVEAVVTDTVEEDLAGLGIIVSDIDESYAGVYYSIGENSLYKEPNMSSESLQTVEDEGEVTAIGLFKNTEFFKVTTADGKTGYMQGVALDTIKGGYNESMAEEPDVTPAPSTGLNEYGVTDEIMAELIANGEWQWYLVEFGYASGSPSDISGELVTDTSATTGIDWSSVDCSGSTGANVN